jgi:hypothetical protein
MRDPFMTDVATFGTLVFDTIGAVFHRGDKQLDPDSDEGIELRKAALSAMNARGDDPVAVSGQELAYAVLWHLQGLEDFGAVKAASRAYEEARIKARAEGW